MYSSPWKERNRKNYHSRTSWFAVTLMNNFRKVFAGRRLALVTSALREQPHLWCRSKSPWRQRMWTGRTDQTAPTFKQATHLDPGDNHSDVVVCWCVAKSIAHQFKSLCVSGWSTPDDYSRDVASVEVTNKGTCTCVLNSPGDRSGCRPITRAMTRCE